jgi:histidinol-phosphate aminotransferase
MSILARLRPAIAGLSAYSSAHMEKPAQATAEPRVRLNANELPYAPAVACGRALNRYPHPQPPELVQRLAEIFGAKTGQMLLTRGSDEAIDLLVRSFCEAGKDAMAITPPVFGMYRVAADIQGAQVLEFPLRETRNFQPDLAAMARQLPANIKLVFLCSPNNPLGNALPRAEILAFCQALADTAVVVVDEAYIEFSDQHSLVDAVDATPNLVVLRTLSKAWGLAGARLGALVGQQPLIAALRPVLAPYPIAEPVRHAVMQATADKARQQAQKAVQTVLAERSRLQQLLQESSLVDTVFPSQTNFLLVRFRHADAVFRACAEAGLLVRQQGNQPGLANCLRLTVGSVTENNRLLAVLATLAQKTMVATGR